MLHFIAIIALALVAPLLSHFNRKAEAADIEAAAMADYRVQREIAAARDRASA